MTCFFRKFSDTPCIYRADGLPDRAHLVSQQRIRHVGQKRGWPASKIGAATWDKRCYVPACRRHHSVYDSKLLRLEADDFPPEMHEWAAENDFEYRNARDGWVGLYRPPEDSAA